MYAIAKAYYCALSKRLIYIGKVFRQKHRQFHAAIMPPLFAWGTLDDSTQIALMLFILQHPMWPRKVGMAKSLREIEKVLPKNFANVIATQITTVKVFLTLGQVETILHNVYSSTSGVFHCCYF